MYYAIGVSVSSLHRESTDSPIYRGRSLRPSWAPDRGKSFYILKKKWIKIAVCRIPYPSLTGRCSDTEILSR